MCVAFVLILSKTCFDIGAVGRAESLHRIALCFNVLFSENGRHCFVQFMFCVWLASLISLGTIVILRVSLFRFIMC